MTSLQEHFDVAIPASPAPDKVYVGRRQGSGIGQVTILEAGKERPLPSLDPRDLFDWGYFGDAPRCLAGAILFDHLGYEITSQLVTWFLVDIVAKLRRDGWSLGSADVAGWLSRRLRGSRG